MMHTCGDVAVRFRISLSPIPVELRVTIKPLPRSPARDLTLEQHCQLQNEVSTRNSRYHAVKGNLRMEVACDRAMQSKKAVTPIRDAALIYSA